MLQVFHMDVAKVDRDVAYVAIAIHKCCKRLFQIFHLFFRRMLQVFLFWCCICFTDMLQVFLSVYFICFAMASQVCSGAFAIVSDTRFKCFICLQIDVVNISSGCFKSRTSIVRIAMWLNCHSRLLQLLERRGCVWEAEGWSIVWPRARKMEGGVRGAARACSSRGRPDVRVSVLP